MKTLNKVAEDNLGGLLKLYLIPSFNINVVSIDPETGTGEISFFDEAANWLMYHTPELTGYSQKENEEGIFENDIKGFIPGDSPELQLQIEQLRGRSFSVIYSDDNENFKLVGRKNFPLRFLADYNTRQRTNELKGYNFTLNGTDANTSVFITDPF